MTHAKELINLMPRDIKFRSKNPAEIEPGDCGKNTQRFWNQTGLAVAIFDKNPTMKIKKEQLFPGKQFHIHMLFIRV